MRRSDLGEFEELVLLTVAALAPMAYTINTAEALEAETGHMVTNGAVHSALQRLEQKGYLRSDWGEATAERGGRRKRLFIVTALGRTYTYGGSGDSCEALASGFSRKYA